MDDAEIAQVIENLRTFAILVAPTVVPDVVTDDPDDDKFLACALAGSADLIVSGDQHLLTLGAYEAIPTITPAAFLLLLAQHDGDA